MANMMPGGSSSFYGATPPSGGAVPTNGFYAAQGGAQKPQPSALSIPGPVDVWHDLTGTGGGSGTAPSTPSSSTTYDPNTNYGNSGMSQSAYYAEFGDPNQQGAAASAAGKAADAAGTAQVNNPSVNPNLPNSTVPGAPGPSMPGVLSGPGYGEAFEAAHGNDLTGPSKSSSLYDEGVSATNPYYQNAMKVTNAGIDMAEAARGEGNSGAALAEIGSADANLSGQQALGQANLASQADAADTSRFTAAATAANNAEGQTTNRVNSAASAYTNLSNDQAQAVDNFYSMAEKGQLTGDMASIESQLAASGVDAATAQAIANDLLQVGAIATKAAGK